MIIETIMWGIGLGVVLIGVRGFRVIRQTQRGLVERFGKYVRFCTPGLSYIVPFIEKVIKVNVTERMMNIQPQDIITKDNLNARVDLVVYYQVSPDNKSVYSSRYNVDNFEDQIVSLAQTTARNVIGDMVFKDVNSKRNTLNNSLRTVLDEEAENWGVKVVRVELKEITPPQDVQETMNRVIKAENLKDAAKDEATAKETIADGERRASIQKAEGEKRSRILTAEGVKESSILVAEGQKQADILKAQGESVAFKLIDESFKGNAIELKKLEVTQSSLENNSKIILTEKGIKPNLIMDAIPIKGNREENRNI